MKDGMLFLPDEWTQGKLDKIIRDSSKIQDAGRRISLLSERLSGTPYREHTLRGDLNTPEVFVVNLEGVDCFTFIDYVEAMRLSGSFPDFVENLKKVRYRDGLVSFDHRNHFFTDWIKSNAAFVTDATPEIGGAATVTVQKTLNKKEDGSGWVPGLPQRNRNIQYIPSCSVNDRVLGRLRTGDYAGIYSDVPGLDVSHVGIVIKKEENIYLRHASSLQKKVAEEGLASYLSGKPGLLVLRPK